jgi:CRISPR-associated protein Csd1
MLIQALAAYADSKDELREALQNVAWEEKPVPWLIEIGHDGRFLGVTPRMDEVTRGKKTVLAARALSIPRSPVNRNSGEHPLLAVDALEYVLGEGPWSTPDNIAKHKSHFAAFVELIGKSAADSQDEALQASTLFYSQPEEVAKAREALKDVKSGAIVALSTVQGAVVLRPSVRKYWSSHYGREYAGRVGENTGECMISGNVGPIAPTHEKIKGATSLGGQASGVSLMSFDKESFRSYGWDQNQNSPVSPDRAMAYVLAINDLLRIDSGHRRDISTGKDSKIGFLFWLKNPDDFDPFLMLDPTKEQRVDAQSFLDPPREQQVDALLRLVPGADPEPNRFYFAGVSGNGGRLRVRYWLDASLAEIKQNILQWHRQLRVATLYGDEIRPVWMWQIEQALDREGKPPAHRLIALWRRALEGVPLGSSVLAALLSRLRHTKPEEWSAAQLGLLRLCVNDSVAVRSGGEGEEMKEDLDNGQMHPAYLCGRLLAVYENLQYQASTAGQAKDEKKNVNVTVADRYYALASTCPQIAFPKIVELGQKHLRKLRRDKPGAAFSIKQLIEELQEALGNSGGYKFPAQFSLEDQGRFSLGFYHQSAATRTAAMAAKQNRVEQSNQDQKDEEN